MTKAEIHNRTLEIVFMICAILFSLSVILLLNDFIAQESRWRGCLIFTGYGLFGIFSVIHCLHGVYVYKKQEHYGVLFQAILSGVCALAALANLQFALVLIFSALGLDSYAEKFAGSGSLDDFVSAQSGAWIMLIFAIALAIVIGMTGIVRLATGNRK